MEHFDIKIFSIVFLAFHGFLLASLISIGQLIADRKSIKTWLFLGLFFVFSLFQIHYILFEIGLLHKYRLVNVFPITAFYLLGPLIYFITRHSLYKNYTIQLFYFFHFIPTVFISLITLFFIFTTKFQTISLLSGYFYNMPVLYIGIGGSFIFLVYLIVSIRELLLAYMLSKQTILNNSSAFIVFIILALFILAWISDLVAFISNHKLFMDISLLLITLIVIFLFLINFRYPDYYKILYNVAEDERKKRSYLTGIDLRELDSKLTNLMTTEEIFTDENLSLSRLAQKLNVSHHQFSQFLNERKGENFSSFINKYRIEKAKKMLIVHPDKKILAIAYDVGFKSKSTFNATFSRFEKMTPHEFRSEYAK